MPVTQVREDREGLRLVHTCELPVPPAAAWELWSDPRRLESWLGPRDYPGTVTAHDLVPGGAVAFHLTSPEGDRYHGWWEVLEVSAPDRLALRGGFAHDDGTPNEEQPVSRVDVQLEPLPEGGTRITLVTSFADAFEMTRLVNMGALGAMREAMAKMDGVSAGR